MMLLAECAGGIIFFYGNRRRPGFHPWEAGALMSRFRAAGRHLKFLTDTALPYLEGVSARADGTKNCALLGYSLGEIICALGADERRKIRCRCKLSGSLWYPQFLKYLENCPPKKDTTIYLSLGDREPLGPPVMRTVGDCTEKKAKGDFKRSRLQVFFGVESRRARQGRHQTLAARRATLTMMAKKRWKSKTKCGFNR